MSPVAVEWPDVQDVTLLHFDGYPLWQLADEGLRASSAELGLTVTRQQVNTAEAAQRWGFVVGPPSSSTVRMCCVRRLVVAQQWLRH